MQKTHKTKRVTAIARDTTNSNTNQAATPSPVAPAVAPVVAAAQHKENATPSKQSDSWKRESIPIVTFSYNDVERWGYDVSKLDKEQWSDFCQGVSEFFYDQFDHLFPSLGFPRDLDQG
jgi:hypothetical protein